MAAPSGTIWGSIAGGYGRIGLYISQSLTNTTAAYTFQVWFWSKYSVSDSNNTLYLDALATSGSATTAYDPGTITTTVASGSGWSTSNQVLIKSVARTYTRINTNQNMRLYAKLANVDRVGATMEVNTTFTIPILPSYAVTYNANGGVGAPATQTKYYGKTLTLQTITPTRTGYTFKGWATTKTGAVAYAPGASYTANAAATLYAVWQAITYTVTYNANGGTDAPSSQTKQYGTALTLTTSTPTRTGYTFKGWATSATSTTVSYAPGASYTPNAAITLYAVWEPSYVKPRIYNLTATRTEDGTSVTVSFDWETTNADPEIDIAGDLAGSTLTPTGTSGTATYEEGNLNPETTYRIEVYVNDGGGENNASVISFGTLIAFDVLAEGKGVSFGKPAELEGVADFAFDAKFNNPVYGKALGMDRLPTIPENSDFNDYKETGCYAVHGNTAAKTISNIPVNRAGRLEVWSSTGEGIRDKAWSYIRQRYVPYNSANAVWERDISRSSDNVWVYYDWWNSTLTPAAAEKVYSKAAITVALSANTTLGIVGSYTQIPLDRVAISTSDRLTLEGNAVKIGANISYVKVSAQTLIKCGSSAGARHVRIQKVSGSKTTSVSWTCINGAAVANVLYPLTPAIVSVEEGDMLKMVFYTSVDDDMNASGSADNGWQTYMTVEEL